MVKFLFALKGDCEISRCNKIFPKTTAMRTAPTIGINRKRSPNVVPFMINILQVGANKTKNQNTPKAIS